MDEAGSLPLIDGRYRLLRLLAVGGMGEVYLASARDEEIEGLEQLVVIKRILPAYARDPRVVTMFLIEARIAARLDHPNVVRVYDMGKADGNIYFTMEYLHGADLGTLFERARVSREGFPLGHALTITLGICAGLHFAHEMRRVDGRPMEIVHRDVSPSNVFITFHGEVKLVDFGIAKVVSSTQLTQDGTRKGKVAYMSPEQVKSDPIDRRSDVFGIGILLYEMVTLTHLFDGKHDYDIMEQIAQGRVDPPSRRKPGIPAELERIIMKALALSPAQRYQTALELAQDVERFAVEHEIPLSYVALREFLKRTVGDVPFPWYTDERDPAEYEAVQHWFAGAQPTEAGAETEDLEVGISGMFELDLEEVFVEPEPEPEPPPRIQLPPLRPKVHPLLVVGGAMLLLAATLLVMRRCKQEPPPPPPAPVVAPPVNVLPPVNVPPPPPPAPPSPPSELDIVLEDAPPEPAPEPAKKRAKGKKDRGREK
ncbi:MAG TPA: serine/threonine-protein kinase [Nannocystis sp.]